MTKLGGNITYTAYALSEDAIDGIAATLGFDEEGKEWFVYRVPRLTIRHKDIFEEESSGQFGVYLPTDPEVVKLPDGQIKTIQRPKFLNYLFVLARPEEVEQFYRLKGYCPVYRPKSKAKPKAGVISSTVDTHITTAGAEFVVSPTEKWLTVPKRQMHMLMAVIIGGEKQVRFEAPDSQLLAKGEKVRVAEGPSQGVEGVLFRDQRKGGELYVELTTGLSFATATIPDEYIKVLEVPREGNRFFRTLESFERTLEGCAATLQAGDPLDYEQRSSLEFFLYRYSELAGLTFLTYTKLVACQYAAYRFLRMPDEAEATLQRFRTESETNPTYRRALQRSPSSLDHLEKWIDRCS